MESKYFYQSGMCLKILKTTEFRKYCNQARLSFKRSSGLSNAYMDTTSGLYVLKEHKDRINKKTTFPTIRTLFNFVSQVNRFTLKLRLKLPLQQNRKRIFHLIVCNIFFVAAGLSTFRHEKVTLLSQNLSVSQGIFFAHCKFNFVTLLFSFKFLPCYFMM